MAVSKREGTYHTDTGNLRICNELTTDKGGKLMETNIFIRAQIDGKWVSVDIGDERLSSEEVVSWLRSRKDDSPWVENVVLCLLGKEQIAHLIEE